MKKLFIAAIAVIAVTGPVAACSQPWTYFSGTHWVTDSCGDVHSDKLSGGFNVDAGLQVGNNNAAGTNISGSGNVAVTVQNGSGNWHTTGISGNGGAVIAFQQSN